MEVILKSIAYGFVLGHKNCYMRNYMNIVDFVVVAFSLFNMGVSMMGKPDRFQFKTVRIIRVVRMLKISSNLKRVINCLVNSLQRIIYFLVLYILLLFIYSVIGECLCSCCCLFVACLFFYIKFTHNNYSYSALYFSINFAFTEIVNLAVFDKMFCFLKSIRF